MSDFKKLFESQDDDVSEAEPEDNGATVEPTIAPAPVSAVPKRGRAKGKRSDPNYTQVGAYIPKELDLAVKGKLLGSGQDFSELIADLLVKWLSG